VSEIKIAVAWMVLWNCW